MQVLIGDVPHQGVQTDLVHFADFLHLDHGIILQEGIVALVQNVMGSDPGAFQPIVDDVFPLGGKRQDDDCGRSAVADVVGDDESWTPVFVDGSPLFVADVFAEFAGVNGPLDDSALIVSLLMIDPVHAYAVLVLRPTVEAFRFDLFSCFQASSSSFKGYRI